MSDSRKPWRASESRPIPPFRISKDALAGMRFRIRHDLEFSCDEAPIAVLEPDELKHPAFCPEFSINVNLTLLQKDTGLDIDDLVFSFIVRDAAAWRSYSVAEWPLREVPETYAIPKEQLAALSGVRGLEFAAQISPAKPLQSGFRVASRPGQIVATRSFQVGIPEEASGFPIELVDPSYFKSIGLPEETLWILHWKSTVDFDRPIEEVLTVVMNKEVGEKLLRLSAHDSLGNVIWREIAVEIFVEICLTIFGADPEEPKDPNGLLGKLVSKFQHETSADFNYLLSIAREPPSGARYFRAHLQSSFELGDRIKSVRLAGRIQ